MVILSWLVKRNQNLNSRKKKFSLLLKVASQARNVHKPPFSVINWTFFPQIQILIFLRESTQNDHIRLLYKFENDQKNFGCVGSCRYVPASVKYITVSTSSTFSCKKVSKISGKNKVGEKAITFGTLKMHRNVGATSEMIWPYWTVKNPHNPQIARIPQLKPSWIEKIALQINVSNLQLCCSCKLRGRSQTTFTRFGFFWPPTPLRWHFLWYKRWPKVDIFDHLPPSSCKYSLWTTPWVGIWFTVVPWPM